MTGRREAEQLELARRAALGERDPVGRRRPRLRRVVADPVVARDLEGDSQDETRAARCDDVDPAVEHVVPVGEQRAPHPGCRSFCRVQLGVSLGHDQRCGRVAPFGITPPHEVGRRGSVVDVGEIEERLEVPPRRAARCGEPRVVPIGVHRLLVVRLAGELGRGVRLVEAQLGGVERTLGKVDDRGMHAQPVERARSGKREVALPHVLFRTKAGTPLGPRVRGARRWRPAQPAFALAGGVGVVLLRRRVRLGEVGDGRVDLVGRNETLDQNPAVVAPRRDIVVPSQDRAHRLTIARAARRTLPGCTRATRRRRGPRSCR